MKLFQKIYISLVAFAISTSCINAQQIPYIPVDNFNPQGPGQQTISYPFGITAPTSPSVPDFIGGSSRIDFIGGQRVQLHDGFHAGGFTGQGYFHASIGTAPDFDVAFMTPNQNTPDVGQYEKLEIGVTLPATLEQQVNDFLANGTGGLNPFDPDQISVETDFTQGAQHYTVYGFYYDEFIRDPNAMAPFAPANWISQQTNYHWRIRFAPPTLGNWYCSISIRINNASNYSYAVNGLYFQCVPSSNKGWLRKGNDNWHLAYSNNESFFAIGQNIGWNDFVCFNGGQYHQQDWVSGYTLFGSGYLDVLGWISNLSDNGGNMVRVSNFPTSFELELTHLNNYSDRLNRAWELDRLIELCEQKGVKISMGMADKRNKKFDPSRDDPNSLGLWNNNPYNSQNNLLIQGVNHYEDFLTNADARKIFKNKIRYFLSRWGYSTSIGIFDLIGEVDGGDYNVDEQTKTEDLSFWHDEMFRYVRLLSSYRNLLISSSYNIGTHPGDFHPGATFDLDNCDITSLHWYKPDRKADKLRFDEFNKHNGTHEIWDDKPTYFGEMGTFHIDSDIADDGDMDACNDITFHNSLWASAFMGGFGTGLYWWSWNNDIYRQDNFPALKTFFEGIDFQHITFKDPDFWDDALISSHSNIETFYINDENKNRVMGWVHNTSYWWGNMIMNCTDRHGISRLLPSDDDNDISSPQILGINTQFEVHGLNNLSHFTLDWYLTRFAGGILQTETYQSNIFGTLKPYWLGGGADFAFKAYRAGNNFRENNEITYDTLFCWEDTVEAKGNHELDSLHNFSYHWNFGNGQVSNERNTFVVYSQPGTYLVTLIVSDSLGWSDTLKQFIIKPPCTGSRFASSQENTPSSTWNVFPNPCSKYISFTFDTSWSSIILAELYTLDGRCILKESISSKEPKSLPVEGLMSGFYFLRVTDNNRYESKRIIIIH
jgi:hypothetical protein